MVRSVRTSGSSGVGQPGPQAGSSPPHTQPGLAGAEQSRMEIPWPLWATWFLVQSIIQRTKCTFFASKHYPLSKLYAQILSAWASQESPAAGTLCPCIFLYIHPVPPMAQGFAFPFFQLSEVAISPFLQLSPATGQLQLLHWDQPATVLLKDRKWNMRDQYPTKGKQGGKKGQDQRENANRWYSDTPKACAWHNIKLLKFHSCKSLAWYHQSWWELQEHLRGILAEEKQL